MLQLANHVVQDAAHVEQFCACIAACFLTCFACGASGSHPVLYVSTQATTDSAPPPRCTVRRQRYLRAFGSRQRTATLRRYLALWRAAMVAMREERQIAIADAYHGRLLCRHVLLAWRAACAIDPLKAAAVSWMAVNGRLRWAWRGLRASVKAVRTGRQHRLLRAAAWNWRTTVRRVFGAWRTAAGESGLSRKMDGWATRRHRRSLLLHTFQGCAGPYFTLRMRGLHARMYAIHLTRYLACILCRHVVCRASPEHTATDTAPATASSAPAVLMPQRAFFFGSAAAGARRWRARQCAGARSR